jgi:V/A-type H+-transporting ATPase subunit I
MIVDLKKYLFIGARHDLNRFFEKAQQRGCLEFISLNKMKPCPHPEVIERLISGIKILRKLPHVKQQQALDLNEALEIVDLVIHNKHYIETLQEELRILRVESARVAPLGVFARDDLAWIAAATGRTIQFFCMKSAKRPLLEEAFDLLYIGTEYDLDYYIAISESPIHPPYMIEMQVDRPINELKTRIKQIEEQLDNARTLLKSLVQWIELLQARLIVELDDFHLESAKHDVEYPLASHLFSITAWVPSDKMLVLFAMLKDMAVHAEPVAIEEGDRVPTYMCNQGIGKIGEDIVLIYDTPGANDRDPSRWVFWWFAIFFAMIINDAGYGFLFLGLALFLKYKFPQLKGAGKRYIQLMMILAVTCMGWGVLTGSYFGIAILPKNPLNQASILNYFAAHKADFHLQREDKVYHELIEEYPVLSKAKNGEEMIQVSHIDQSGRVTYPVMDEFYSSIMLEISILIGVVHLGISLLRYLGRNWAAIGWLMFLIGSYLYLPKVIGATSLINYLGIVDQERGYAIGGQLIGIGITSALLLAILQKRRKGLGEIMHLVEIFADTLSYLRLYALALASTVMAQTFNGLGADAGLVVGGLIVLGGHAINLVLGSMSGVIHGLRLNFLEWYHYSFEGGGRLFAPLRKIKK